MPERMEKVPGLVLGPELQVLLEKMVTASVRVPGLVLRV
jgi:hypothetical protein